MFADDDQALPPPPALGEEAPKKVQSKFRQTENNVQNTQETEDTTRTSGPKYLFLTDID